MIIGASTEVSSSKFRSTWHQESCSYTIADPSQKDLRRKPIEYCPKPVMTSGSCSLAHREMVRRPLAMRVLAILARTSSGGTSAWYLPDKLGTIRDIADTSGSVIDQIVYN